MTYLQDLDLALDSGIQVYVVGAYTGCDTDLQVLGLCDLCEIMLSDAKVLIYLFHELPSQISGVEGSRNQHVGLGQQ